MADLKTNLKSLWMKGMEAVGNTASSIASNTRYKVEEMNLLNRRREILSDFGAKAYALWQKGECDGFPEELQKDLQELTELDNQLVDMRAEHFAGQDAEGSAEEKAKEAGDPADGDAPADEADDGSDAPCEAAEDAREPEKSCEPEEETAAEKDAAETNAEIPADEAKAEEQQDSVQKEISDLFDGIPAVDAMAEKLHDTLNQMEDSLKKFDAGQDGGSTDQ